MKVHIEEDGSSLVRERIGQAGIVITSLIAYAEARAAFARRLHLGHLSPGDYRRVLADFEVDWGRYVGLGVTEPLIREAGHLAETHRLRAYDAIHLASAKVVAQQPGDLLVFGSWDADLEAAAAREGFQPLRPRRK